MHGSVNTAQCFSIHIVLSHHQQYACQHWLCTIHITLSYNYTKLRSFPPCCRTPEANAQLKSLTLHRSCVHLLHWSWLIVVRQAGNFYLLLCPLKPGLNPTVFCCTQSVKVGSHYSEDVRMDTVGPSSRDYSTTWSLEIPNDWLWIPSTSLSVLVYTCPHILS